MGCGLRWSILQIIFITLGALIILISRYKYKSLLNSKPWFFKNLVIERLSKVQAGLMLFFVFGYIFITIEVLNNNDLATQSLTCLVLAIGAVFIFLTVLIYFKMTLVITSVA